VKDIEAVFLHQLPQFEESPETEGFDLREDPEAGRNEFIKIQGREDGKGIPRGEKVGFLAEVIVVLDGVDDRSLQEKRKRRADEDVHFMAQFYSKGFPDNSVNRSSQLSP
jgi:hypothetical protein